MRRRRRGGSGGGERGGVGVTRFWKKKRTATDPIGPYKSVRYLTLMYKYKYNRIYQSSAM